MDKEDKEFENFKKKFYKILWDIFIFVRVPIILVWLSFFIGFFMGIYASK